MPIPWYADPTKVCCVCYEVFGPPSLMEKQACKQVSIWASLVNHIFKPITFALQLKVTLLAYAQEHPELLPNDDDAVSQEEQEMMEQFNQFNKTFPSTGCKYQYNHPTNKDALLQLRILEVLISSTPTQRIPSRQLHAQIHLSLP